jgi:hypothetical protein
MFGEAFFRDFFSMPPMPTASKCAKCDPKGAPKTKMVSDDNPYLVALISELLTTLHKTGVLTETEAQAIVTRARARAEAGK